jgi:hypothetical protein
VETSDIIALFGALLQASATAFIGFVLWKQARQIKQMEFNNAMVEALNHMNAVALSDPELLKKFEELVGTGEDGGDPQKEWALFMWLNILELLVLNRRMMDKDMALYACDPIVDVMVQKNGPYVVSLLDRRGYSRRFAKYVRERLAKVAANNSVPNE